jgi:hypothetical protein
MNVLASSSCSCVFDSWNFSFVCRHFSSDVFGRTTHLRENGTFFECFPYVCSEPVLVK